MIIVLDLDGTLIDSARDLADSIGEMLADYGAPALPFDDVVQMVGDGAPILVRLPSGGMAIRCLHEGSEHSCACSGL